MVLVIKSRLTLKKLYIDVTQSHNWSGEATGIIRVMDEIATRFSQGQQFSTVFIVWDESLGLFREVDFLQVLADRVSQSATPIKKAPEKVVITKTKRSVRHAIRSIPLTKTAYRILLSRSRRLEKFFNHNYSVRFEPGSILLMPHGGVWESDINSRRILELKTEKQLKIVPILYDLCPILTPQFCSSGIRTIFKKYMQRILPSADLMLAISKNTAEDARQWLSSIGKTKTAPIKVFRLGDEIAANQPPKEPKTKLPSHFILCVGTIEVRKNHTALYYAYKLAAQKGYKLPKVVVVGRKGWHTEDIYEIITKDPDTADQFIFLHNAPDTELAWLYQHALMSVYPSFYEGWGLPVAESLLRGLPCIASNTSSIPEIGGDLVEYFSPFAPDEIMERIKQLADNPAKRKAIAERLKTEYQATTWDSTYQQIETLLKTIV